MKKQAYAVSMLSAALFLAACDGKDGVNGQDGANGLDGDDGFNSLVAIRDIPKGDADCLGGGKALDSGLDLNRNDVLDANEVTATEILECAATPLVRALHASPDAPDVNIWVNGAVALPEVDYTMGSGFLPVAESNRIQIEADIAGEDDLLARIVYDEQVDFDYSTEKTVIATGTLEGEDFNVLVITNPSDEHITPGNFRAQVVHASPSAPPVDVYVTAPGTALVDAAPFNMDGPLDFEQDVRDEAPEGSYQIRITVAGDKDAVVFDTGETTPVALPAGADLMIVAVENTGPGASPVKLIVLDGQTADTVLYDAATPASVVAVHLSPDAPAVDLLADVTSTPEVEAIPLVRNVSFTEFCDISVPAPGEYIVNVALNSDNSTIAYSFPSLEFMKGDEALAIVSGFALGGEPVITDITLPGNTRSVLTEAKVRITHSSPITPPVNVKIVERDAGFDAEGLLFENVAFTGGTPQLSVPVGNYDAYVFLPGAAAPAIAVEGVLDFTGGEVLDIIARDGEAGPELLILDYAGGSFLGEDPNVAACPTPDL